MASSTPRIRYQERDGLTILPVNGVFGGPTPRGDSIVCQFFLEYVRAPERQKVTKVEGQEGAFRDAPLQDPDIVRLIQAAVELSPRQALSIGNWLVGHANDMLKQGENGSD